MPIEGMVAYPPLVYREDEDGDRRPDRCAACGGDTASVGRGWTTGLAPRGTCACGPRTWTASDVSQHETYIDLCVSYDAACNGEFEDDDNENEVRVEVTAGANRYVCACPSCRSRADQGAMSPEERRHAAYREQVRSRAAEARRIRGNRTNPVGFLQWNGTPRGLQNRPRMGFEFECDARSESRSSQFVDRLNKAFGMCDLRHATGYLIAKPDGSVNGSYPIEYATVPCTVEEHRRVLDAAFPNGRFGDGQVRAWGNASAGMHVHLSRLFVSALTIGKMGVFFHHFRNDTFWTEMCGRAANNYCKRSPTSVRDVAGDGDRYSAFNKCPTRTVEVRIFRPSSVITSICKNMELVESSAEFCRLSPICATTADDPGPFGWQGYLRWLSAPPARKKYDHLHHWLLSKPGDAGEFYRALLPRNVRMVGPNRRRGFEEFSLTHSSEG